MRIHFASNEERKSKSGKEFSVSILWHFLCASRRRFTKRPSGKCSAAGSYINSRSFHSLEMKPLKPVSSTFLSVFKLYRKISNSTISTGCKRLRITLHVVGDTLQVATQYRAPRLHKENSSFQSQYLSLVVSLVLYAPLSITGGCSQCPIFLPY